MNSQAHWDKIYTEKSPDAVSWYRPHLETSLSLIERVGSKDSAIVDVGGGESTLVDDLLGNGYRNITVLDISAVPAGSPALSRFAIAQSKQEQECGDL